VEDNETDLSEMVHEAADVLVEKFYITRTVALKIIKTVIEETKTNVHSYQFQ
jgi:hypothetical protein